VTVYEIHHDVPRFAAVMNRAAKLGLAVDPVRKVHVTTDPEQAAQMRRVGARIVEREGGQQA
jgi:hypothetical protein